MTDNKELIGFLDEQITIRKKWMSSKQEWNITILTEIKGILEARVTEREIRRFATSLFRVIPGPQERLRMEEKLRVIFKSKGFEVKDEKEVR